MTGRKSVDERGFVIIIIAFALLILICVFAGFAIDVGRAYVASTELQNIADGAALAGARTAYRFERGANVQAPALSGSGQAAYSARWFAMHKGSVDGKQLTADPQVSCGFWNMSAHKFEKEFDCSSNAPPPGVCAPVDKEPKKECFTNAECGTNGSCLLINPVAVKVTVSRDTFRNEPLGTYFIGGISQLTGASRRSGFGFRINATAVAAMGMPSAMPSKLLFPFAIRSDMKECFMQDHGSWGEGQNFAYRDAFALTGSYASYIERLAGKPYYFKVGTWTSFPSDVVTVGSRVTKVTAASDINALFKKARDLVGPPISDCSYGVQVYVPVVDDPEAKNATPPNTMEVRGFIALRISSAEAPTMIGCFSGFYRVPETAGVKRYGGEVSSQTPPFLVR